MYLFNFFSSLLLMLTLLGEYEPTPEMIPGEHLYPQEVTVEIIGIDKMKFVVAGNGDQVVVGETIETKDGEQYWELEALKAEPGSRLTLKLTTKSTLPPKSMSHNWVLLKPGADRAEFDKSAVLAVDNNYIPREKEDEIIAQTGLAAGGETVEVTFTVPTKQGMYDYLCSFPGHFANGMRGKLIVQHQK